MKNVMIEAFELKRLGYYKQAIEIYYKLLSETADNIEILAELAELYFLMKNSSKALHYLEKVFEIDSNHVQSLCLLKDIHVEQGDYKSAIDVARKIFKINDDDLALADLFSLLFKQKSYEDICEYSLGNRSSQCLYWQAKSFFELGHYEDAKCLLERIDSDFSEQMLLFAGRLYSKLGLVDKVKEVYRKLRDIDLNDSKSINFVGLNYLEELKLDKAIECFKQAVSLEKDCSEYYYNLGQAYFLKGWIDEAQKSFNSAICINPMEESYHYSLAYLLYRTGDYDNAIIHLDGAGDNNLNSMILRLVIQSEKGNLATPKIELEKMLSENPDNETILFALAKIYFKLDMFKQSKVLMEDVLKLNQKSFEYKEYYIRLLLKLGELESADSMISELAEQYPKYYYSKVLQAEFCMLNKDFDGLFDVAQELIELDMNHYEGYYYNAVALFEKDDVNFAIESLKKAITLDVNNADLYVKMGEFYQAIGKYEDAFEYIKEASDIDKSAKNKELYIQLSSILRKRNLQSE